MVAHHIHDALAQVKQLKELIIEKRFFRGYSGRARILSGIAALAGTIMLGSDLVPPNPFAHLVGWSITLAVGLILNYAALAYWFLFNPKVRRTPMMVKPAVDAIPALAVGAVLSMAAIAAREFDLLFGIWMCLYGLAQVAYRLSLPRGIYLVGIAYITCGFCCLWLRIPFTNPWPMGLTFCLGEMAGGISLLRYGDDNDERNSE